MLELYVSAVIFGLPEVVAGRRGEHLERIAAGEVGVEGRRVLATGG